MGNKKEQRMGFSTAYAYAQDYVTLSPAPVPPRDHRPDPTEAYADDAGAALRTWELAVRAGIAEPSVLEEVRRENARAEHIAALVVRGELEVPNLDV
jgi:hypothetical protein